MARWKSDPSSRPKSRDPKTKTEAQAYALCTATLKKQGKLSDAELFVALTEAGDGDIAGRVAIFEEIGYSNEEAITMAFADRDAGKDKLDGLGPVLTGVALTIRPFVKRQEEAKLREDDDGRQIMEIPLLRKSMWRHPLYGVLKFDDNFINTVSTNFKNNVFGQRVPIKDGHRPREQHALGWVEDLGLDENQFYVYAPATGEKGPDLIKSKKAPYASAEFAVNYRDHEIKALSFEGMELTDEVDEGVYEFSEEELAYIELRTDHTIEETEMPNETETPDVVQLSNEEWTDLQDRVTAAEGLATRLETLETQLSERETRITELETINEQALVQALTERARAYRDAEGNAHSAVFLNAYEAALGMSEFVDGDVEIVLAEDVTAEAVRDYYRRMLRYLAETQPGVVPTEGNTEAHDDRELESEEVPEDFGADLWEGV
jgi:hypothetical protein